MQKKLLIIFLSLSIAVCSCGLIYGMTSVEVTNEFQTGIVDIRLEEFQKVNDKEEAWEDNPTVLPGDTISKIPRIFNDGNDCYVRAKLTFRDTAELNDAHLFGISDKWLKADDGYYYYTEILPHGEDVDIFEGLNIPEDFAQKEEGEPFYIDIDVDAIQSKNFTPQFDLAKPWGDIEILACGKEGQYDISTFKQADDESFSVVYQGKAKKLVKNADDFFGNFPYLIPGDTYSDTLELENDSANEIKLYFRSSAEDVSELLDKIQLKITTEIAGKKVVFYEGDLRAEDLSKDVILGRIPAGKDGKFHFEIYVPHELNNQFSISSSFVKWIFSTEEIDNPKTGDNSQLVLWTSSAGLALSGLILVNTLLAKKKKTEEGSAQ